jgi:predicted transcriptional regulator
MNVGKSLKLAATAASLLVIISGLIAGVMDTKVRVNVLERDTQKLEDCLDRHVEKAANALDRIQEGVHKIDKEQTALGTQLRDLIERLDRNP